MKRKTKLYGSRIAILLKRIGRRKRSARIWPARMPGKKSAFRLPGDKRIRVRKFFDRPPIIRRAVERCFRGELPF